MNAKKNAAIDGSDSNAMYVVRQDRVQSNSRSLTLKSSNETFPVVNFSLFGLGFESGKEMNLGDILSCELRYNDLKVSDFSVEIKRKDGANGKFYYGSEVLDSVVPVEDINFISRSYSILEEAGEKYNRYENIPEKIKFYVDDLFIWFSELEEKVKSIETSHFENVKQKQTAFKNISLIIGDSICTKLKKSNSSLGQLLSQDMSNSKLIFEYYRYRLGKFIFQSPFTKRSYDKPRGYAGDFEMMNQIYRNDFFANSLFGSCMELAVSMHEEPAAVRNRVDFLSKKIIEACSKGAVNILTVASGPAEEIKAVISALSAKDLSKITFNLLDQDEDALRYAQRNIKEHSLSQGKEVNTKLLKKDIKDVIISGLQDQYDLIYSAGLFDYFSDPVASRACKALYKSLKPNSKLVIGNFNSEAPNTFGMLALFDWYLILRNEKDLKRIFEVSGANITIEHEPENVNLFCVIKKEK